MPNRLAEAISPYLRSHAGNPVEWYSWGDAAFDEAVRRDVPVLVSIGYSTCHWCHVMARESFSDPQLAEVLNRGFVAIKVDREEHPEVDAFFMAAAGAFTQNLGWPLNVFATPLGRPFFAGTYSPPVAVQGVASFRQVLDAVSGAWRDHRAEVEQTAQQLVAALARAGERRGGGADSGEGRTSGAQPGDEHGEPKEAAAVSLPTAASFERVVLELEGYEDRVHGGFGGAPKFPVAPVLGFLLAADSPIALRTLEAMAASPLRDAVEGGFFRYATKADWSEPHYERMLYDNALLLDAYTTAAQLPGVGAWAYETARGVAGFLVSVLQVDGGGFASAQDSESEVNGEQSEGGYYLLDAVERRNQVAPRRDEKIVTGWNGLAIAALARAGALFGEQEWVRSAVQATEFVLGTQLLGDGALLRVSLAGRVSDARATLEDYGMFATALGVVAAVTLDARYELIGRQLVDATVASSGTGPEADTPWPPFVVPGGGDPVLAARGLFIAGDVSEGAYPSGISAMSRAAIDIAANTHDGRYADLALRALAPIVAEALARPIGYGAALEQLYRLHRANAG